MPANKEVFDFLINHYLVIPYSKSLGLRFESEENQKVVMSVDWREDLVGNTNTQTIHSGVITALLKMVSAGAVSAKLPDYELISLLDMRIDYMHPAQPRKRIFAQAECYRLTGEIAFVRSHCYQDDPDDPIALGMTAIMRSFRSEAEKQQLLSYLKIIGY